MTISKLHTENFPVLSYRKTGEGPAVVLLHGFPEDGSLWERIWGSLSLHFTVIIPDLPFAGESTFTGGSLSIPDMAKSVKLVMDAEGIDKAVLAGHSMGGYTAFNFADVYPDRIAGLSAVHSFAFADDEAKKETRRKSIELMKKPGGSEAFVRQMIPGLFAKGFKQQHPDMVEEQISRAMKMKPDSLIAFYNAMIMREDKTGILEEATYPLQWIVGKEDTIATEDKVLKQAMLAGTNFVSVYADCAHMSMIEKPEQLIDDLIRFSKYCFSRYE